MVKPGCDHGAVKTRPLSSFQEEQLDDVQVAIPKEAFRPAKTLRELTINEIVRAVAAARCDHTIDFLFVEGFAELALPLLMCVCKIALWDERRWSVHCKAKPPKLIEAGRNRCGICRGRRGNNGEARSVAQGLWFFQMPRTPTHS
jgi:hypothetical protein